MRRCLECPTLVSSGSRCPFHASLRKRIRNADRPIARAVVAASPVCAQCGATDDLTADHVIALAHGGRNNGERRVLCRSCNSRKGAGTGGRS